MQHSRLAAMSTASCERTESDRSTKRARTVLRYGRVDTDTEAATAALLNSVFVASEPLNMAIGITTEDFQPICSASAAKASNSRHSRIAFPSCSDADQTNTAIIGVVLCDDIATPSALRGVRLSDRFAPIGALIGSMDQWFREHHRPLFKLGTTLMISMVAVHPQHTGQGVARQLLSECLREAQQRKFRYAMSVCTGEASQRVHRAVGFEVVHSRQCATFRFRETYPFEQMGEKAEVQLLLLDLEKWGCEGDVTA
eukprot:TRINITY_DN15178_c0_g1_i1.p1 TRINITY_DN15178_c0_g1~~TRINITY_DN15178_c0_g1_i1.p1  ORF type:complete len:255 (+),score=39.23 TRINITY_DN15178_c0_g1_i1:40-804(+)